MLRKYLLPALALLGLAVGIFMVRTGGKPTPVAPAAAEPAKPPFRYYVAGSGLVESSTENISVGTHVAGVVAEVHRQPGDRVHSGLPGDLVRGILPLVMVANDASTRPAETLPAERTQPPKVDLNHASAEDLAALPGVGERWAARIIQCRPYASVGDLRGTPLFKLDDRAMRADVGVKRAAAEAARSKLEKLLKGTREEEIRVAEAQLEEALASQEDARRLFKLWSRISDRTAVTGDELEARRLAVEVNEARFRRAQASYEMLKAGAWEPDVQIARADLASAEAQVRAAETDLDMLTARATVDGKILQVKVRPGEFAPEGALDTPLMLIGRTETLHIRVDVDENEALRVRPGASAVASVRGDAANRAYIKFVRIEPYIVPKRSLTGDSSERVDTRVLQVLYAFEPSELRAYVGQQMDVFIEADAPPGAASTQATVNSPVLEKTPSK